MPTMTRGGNMEAGETVGQYELIRRLGGGAFGEVWLARHQDLHVERAVKIPTDPEYVRQLRREAQIQCIRHANIVETFELYLRADPPHFVMEYVEGENLRQRLNRQGKLAVEETLRILSQVLEALQAAHAEGVLHRDLKPENILLAEDGTVKVTDFGLGKVQAQVTQSLILSGSMVTVAGKSVSGTFEYMSPEQRAGKEPTPRDDIYSLGIIACELLTGERPQPGISIEELFEEAKLHAALARIVRRALARPQRRFRSAVEMIQAIEGVAAGAPAPPQAPPSPRPPARPQARPAPRAPADLITNSIGMKLKLIKPGTFAMGSQEYDNGKPVHQVTIAKPFHLGVYPVTQAEYERVIGTNPAHFKGPKRPVEMVSWNDAQTFCRKLADMEGVHYRLPTEAEWEYACRAGSTTKYCFGDDERTLGDYAWYHANSGRVKVSQEKRLLGLLGTREKRETVDWQTHDVGQKKPNGWGLHDMHGNVWEWCQSLYKPYPYRADDGREDLGADGNRVLRGGSWTNVANACRSAYRLVLPPSLPALPLRLLLPPGARGDGSGFRVARSLP